ncbi:GSCFA domain-containing protein [Tropicimonas sp.]|uniref:GSCFA domain-containing protein n=1 Tax=Tropicimonas sp. TaxID=2067044 RepID=UPI003A88283F
MDTERVLSPYSNLPSRAFWRSAVSERSPLDPGDIYHPRFPISKNMKIATAGSCFAQHVGRALKGANFEIIDTERMPNFVPDKIANRFGYRLYSARYGNIYTSRQLLQLWLESNGKLSPSLPVWERNGHYFDAQRPGVEPDGLPSRELVMEHRKCHLKNVIDAFRQADLFIFTFGLTECWLHRETRTVYPTAPGTIAGCYDPRIFEFENLDVLQVVEDFERFRSELQSVNPEVRFLITVSPVPLTATASDQHVELATCYSKSVLRAACGMLTKRYDDIDYFPSFEVITSLNSRGVYYENNQRSVSPAGVSAAMTLFMTSHGVMPPEGQEHSERCSSRRATNVGTDRNLVCEEALLEAFEK